MKIDAKAIIKMLGLAEREKIFDLLESILKGQSLESLNLYKELYDLGADVIMIFDELINVVHFLTQMKIAPNLRDDIYIPELERSRGVEMSANLSLNNLNIIWQILFKGFQELQNGFHLYQHGEMLILRIIYLFDGSSPDDLLKNITKKEQNESTKEQSFDHSSDKDNSNKVLNFQKDPSVEDHNKQLNKHKDIKNYRHFVELFFKNREGLLHTKLYNDVKLISFKQGEVVLNTDNIHDKSFNRNVGKMISTWTGRIWQIKSSNSNIGKSLYEEDIILQQKEIEIMKNNPNIKEFLKNFLKVKFILLQN